MKKITKRRTYKKIKRTRGKNARGKNTRGKNKTRGKNARGKNTRGKNTRGKNTRGKNTRNVRHKKSTRQRGGVLGDIIPWLIFGSIIGLRIEYVDEDELGYTRTKKLLLPGGIVVEFFNWLASKIPDHKIANSRESRRDIKSEDLKEDLEEGPYKDFFIQFLNMKYGRDKDFSLMKFIKPKTTGTKTEYMKFAPTYNNAKRREAREDYQKAAKAAKAAEAAKAAKAAEAAKADKAGKKGTWGRLYDALAPK
jgi:hypothetical protein